MSSILENIARDLGPARAYRLTVGPEGRSERRPFEAPAAEPLARPKVRAVRRFHARLRPTFRLSTPLLLKSDASGPRYSGAPLKILSESGREAAAAAATGEILWLEKREDGWLLLGRFA